VDDFGRRSAELPNDVLRARKSIENQLFKITARKTFSGAEDNINHIRAPR
jgi:hypothetical protein